MAHTKGTEMKGREAPPPHPPYLRQLHKYNHLWNLKWTNGQPAWKRSSADETILFFFQLLGLKVCLFCVKACPFQRRDQCWNVTSMEKVPNTPAGDTRYTEVKREGAGRVKGKLKCRVQEVLLNLHLVNIL